MRLLTLLYCSREISSLRYAKALNSDIYTLSTKRQLTNRLKYPMPDPVRHQRTHLTYPS